VNFGYETSLTSLSPLGVSRDKNFERGRSADLLSIAELEAGLRILHDGVDHEAFWDVNIVAFRQTLLMAIRETADVLRSPGIPRRWRFELESQVDALHRYVEIADEYVARRARSSALN
jgi:hypothetical protein